MFVSPDAEILRTDAAFGKNGRRFRQHESRPADCATSEMDKVPVVGVTIDARILAHRRDKHTVTELEVTNTERIKKMWHEVYATSLSRICDCSAGLTLASFRPNGVVTFVRGRSFQRVGVLAIEHELTSLVMHRRPRGYDAGVSLRCQLNDFELRIERVPRMHFFQESTRGAGKHQETRRRCIAERGWHQEQ